MSFWETDASEPKEEVKEQPAPKEKKKRGRPFKQAVAAIVAAVAPQARNSEPKPASTPPNPLQGMSEDMRRIEREMRNDFGDEPIAAFKKRRAASWAAGDGATYTFSTHLPENRYEFGKGSTSNNIAEGSKEKFW